MARPRYPRHSGPLPPPLPPLTRTVGQLVGETINAYRRRPWAALGIGAIAASVNLLATELSTSWRLAFVAVVGALAFTAAYVLACSVVHDVRLEPALVRSPFVLGVLVFVPFPLLASLYILPGLAWLALVGLGVPAALVERLGVREGFSRGLALGRADYVHALGALATVTILVALTQWVMFFLLREYADNTQRVAATLTYLVASPLVFLGAALLYTDQAARVGTTREERQRARLGAPSQPAD
jgi:hypothetical protein